MAYTCREHLQRTPAGAGRLNNTSGDCSTGLVCGVELNKPAEGTGLDAENEALDLQEESEADRLDIASRFVQHSAGMLGSSRLHRRRVVLTYIWSDLRPTDPCLRSSRRNPVRVAFTVHVPAFTSYILSLQIVESGVNIVCIFVSKLSTW